MTEFASLPGCPDCGLRLSVDETVHVGGSTFRKLRCQCGQRFETQEQIVRRLPPLAARARRRTPVSTGGHPSVPVGTGGHPPAPVTAEPPASARGVGGVLPSGPVPSLNPVPLSNPDQTPARRKRRTTVEYDPVFDAQWNMTAKTGSKDLAQQWWVENGKPPFGESWVRWEACPEWKQDWYNFPHVVKWLRDGRYKQTPDARVKTPAAATPVLPFAKRVEDEAKTRIRDQRAKSLFGG